MSSSRRARVLATALLAAIGSGCASWHAAPDDRTYRIGFQQAPPRQFVDTQGKPYGSAIDLLDGAARRAHVKLQWIYVQAGPDRGFADGKVDLWPILNQLPERSQLHFTQPFAEVTYWLVSKPQDRPWWRARSAAESASTRDWRAEWPKGT